MYVHEIALATRFEIFHLNADAEPNFHFNKDPDPATHQSDANLRPLVFRPSTPSFEPLKLFSFYFSADKDLVFHSNVDLDPAF
jgi:hypothetical protein